MKLIKQANGKRTIKMSKSEWLSMGKTAGWIIDDPVLASLWRTDHNDSDLESQLRKLYELNYKYEVLKSFPFTGYPKRKENTVLRMEKEILKPLVFVKDTLVILFERWLASHALTDSAEWAEARIRDDAETGHGDFEQTIRGMLMEMSQYNPQYKINRDHGDTGWLMSHLSDVLAAMGMRKYQSVDEKLQELKEQEQNDLEIDQGGYEEGTEDYQYFIDQLEYLENKTLADYLDNGYPLEHLMSDDILKDIYQDYIFPFWYNHWGDRGIDETREVVEEAYDRLQSINGQDLSNDLVNLNIALNTAHQSGSMLDYMDIYTEHSLDKNTLDELSNLDDQIPAWDNDLREIGVQVSS